MHDTEDGGYPQKVTQRRIWGWMYLGCVQGEPYAGETYIRDTIIE